MMIFSEAIDDEWFIVARFARTSRFRVFLPVIETKAQWNMRRPHNAYTRMQGHDAGGLGPLNPVAKT